MNINNWLKANGIRYIQTRDEMDEVIKRGGLFCSRCSKTKSTGKLADVPRNFYISPLNINFYNACESRGFRYAILSDEYGIHFDDEKLAFYDMHPSKLTQNDYIGLALHIKRKCKERGIKELIFYNTSPLMSKPYFKMMKMSKVPFCYFSKIDLIK